MDHLNALTIRENSDELNRLNARISESFKTRGPEWHAACEEFHARFDQLVNPGGGKMLMRVRSGDPVAIELALQFLEVDPMHFRSGYLKEYLWRWLKHARLSVKAKRRLQTAAMAYLHRRISREFWCMAKTMHQLAEPEFWVEIVNTVERAEGPSSNRALYLVAHGANLHAGALIRRQLFHRYLKERWGSG